MNLNSFTIPYLPKQISDKIWSINIDSNKVPDELGELFIKNKMFQPPSLNLSDPTCQHNLIESHFKNLWEGDLSDRGWMLCPETKSITILIHVDDHIVNGLAVLENYASNTYWIGINKDCGRSNSPEKSPWLPVSFPGRLGLFVPDEYRVQGIGAKMIKAAIRHMFKNSVQNTMPIIELAGRAYKMANITMPKIPIIEGWGGKEHRRNAMENFYFKWSGNLPKWFPALNLSKNKPENLGVNEIFVKIKKNTP